VTADALAAMHEVMRLEREAWRPVAEAHALLELATDLADHDAYGALYTQFGRALIAYGEAQVELAKLLDNL